MKYKRHGTMTVMLPRLVATVSIASLCVLTMMLIFTSPSTTGPFGLLALFVSAYFTFVGVISFFLFGANRLLILVSGSMALRRPLRAMSFRKAYYFSTVLAAAPVLLIGMQSVVSVGIYEFILVVLFEIVACLYVSRQMQ